MQYRDDVISIGFIKSKNLNTYKEKSISLLLYAQKVNQTNAQV